MGILTKTAHHGALNQNCTAHIGALTNDIGAITFQAVSFGSQTPNKKRPSTREPLTRMRKVRAHARQLCVGPFRFRSCERYCLLQYSFHPSSLFMCTQPRLLFVAHLPKAVSIQKKYNSPTNEASYYGRWPVGLLLLSGSYTIIFCLTPTTQPLPNLHHHTPWWIYEWISQCPLRGRFIAPTFIQ